MAFERSVLGESSFAVAEELERGLWMPPSCEMQKKAFRLCRQEAAANWLLLNTALGALECLSAKVNEL